MRRSLFSVGSLGLWGVVIWGLAGWARGADSTIEIENPHTLPAAPVPCERVAVGEPDDYKPCIARLPDGELLLTAFHQEKREGNKVREQTLLFRSRDGGRTWSAPEKLDLLGREPYLTALPDGTLFITGHLLAQDVRNIWGYTCGFLHRSTDRGRTWETTRIESEGIKPQASNHSTRNVLRLRDGTLLLGVDYDGGGGPYRIWRSTDNGQSWDKDQTCVPGDFQSQYGFFGGETWLWQAASGRIWALVRVDSNEFPMQGRPIRATNDQADHFILWSSVDDAKTFQRVGDLGDYGEMYMSLLRLRDGRLLLTFTVRDLRPPLGVRALPAVETVDGFEVDFARDRLLLDTKTGARPQGGGFGPTVQLDDGTLVTSCSYRDEDLKTHLEVIRWRLPAGRDPELAEPLTGNWRAHRVRRLGAGATGLRLPAKTQIVSEPWNRVVAVPYLAYLPEKDRLAMLVSCDYPHRPMLTTSDDRGATWSLPRPLLPDEPAHPRHMVGVALTSLGGGGLLCGVEGNRRCVSDDFGETWKPVELPPFADGKPWNQWDPYLVDRDPATGKIVRLMETGYKGSTEGGQNAALRVSADSGKTWTGELAVPQWKHVSEVALVRVDAARIVAACRTDIPASKQGESLDHYEGLGISISDDNGRNWSPVAKLFDWGRHHPSLLKLPTGELVMTYVVRKGYIDTVDGYPQFGIEAVVSRDRGATWDLDHRYVLSHWVGNRKGPSQSLPGPQAWWASSQSTSTVQLPDGSLLTAFGTGYRSQPNAQGMSAPRDVGLVQWRVSDQPAGEERSIRDAPPDSDLRNWLDPLTGKGGIPGGK